MSSHLGVGQTTELLERLRETVRDFAARETKANQDFQAKITALQRRRDDAIEDLDAKLAQGGSDADALFLSSTEAVIRGETIVGPHSRIADQKKRLRAMTVRTKTAR